MGTLLNRRRYMGGGGSQPLPPGYTQLSELSVANDESLWVVTDVPFANVEWRLVFTAKYYSISTSQRQLCGWEDDPWFGCDKGKWNFSGTLVSTNIPKNTQLAVDTWYDFDLTVTPRTYTSNVRLGIFRCNGANNKLYQSHMSVKSFQAYSNDVLVGDFVPCKNPDNEKGLYNLVTNVFSKLQ